MADGVHSPCWRSAMLNEAELVALAGKMAGLLRPPLVIYLQGDLGAGKTTFVRALVQTLGYPGRVKSPTYGLLEHYPLDRLDVLHLDLYRVASPDELEFLGIIDLITEKTVLLVEWPDQGRGALPAADLMLRIEHEGEKRSIKGYAYSSSGNALCDSFQSIL